MHRVLVIDDNQDMRDLMQVILVGAGYEVDVAPDGMAGLARLRAQPSDVVITDIFMPNQDGIETITHVRRDYPQIKVVAVSGGGKLVRGKGYLLTAQEIGAHAVLPKPFDQDELLEALHRLLQ
jgi:CheY-like chemotaxis protein